METVKTQDVSLNDLPWIVDYSPERCTLCGSCVATCTFDAIAFARERINSAARKSGSEESKGPATRLVVRQSAAVAQACTGCGMCEKVCPARAIRMRAKLPRIDRRKCICCFCCQEFCPQGAMKVRRTFVARALGGKNMAKS